MPAPEGQPAVAATANGAAEPVALSPGHPVTWTADGEAMLKKIPFFVRSKVRANVEKYARERGIATITGDVLLAAKEHLGA